MAKKKTQEQTKVKASIKIGVLIPLKEEFLMFLKHFPTHSGASEFENGIVYYKIKLDPNYGTEIVAAYIGAMGPMVTASFVSKAIAHIQPDLVVMMGIAGSVSSHLKLGDVVVGTEINNYLTAAAIGDKPKKKKCKKKKKKTQPVFEASGSNFKSSQFVQALVDNYQIYASPRWATYQAEVDRVRHEEKVWGSEWISESTQVESGKIASGSLLGKSLHFIKLLKKLDRKYIAIEMEGSGLMQAVHLDVYAPATLILRGISDFADDRKEKFDSDRGKFRNLAMHSTVLLFKMMVQDPVFVRRLSSGIFAKLKRHKNQLLERYEALKLINKNLKVAIDSREKKLLAIINSTAPNQYKTREFLRSRTGLIRSVVQYELKKEIIDPRTLSELVSVIYQILLVSILKLDSNKFLAKYRKLESKPPYDVVLRILITLESNAGWASHAPEYEEVRSLFTAIIESLRDGK